MAYVKHNFQPMDILHASEMNEIDEQVYQNSIQSYAKIVTQAEYDALSEAEKNSNVVYYVSDAPFDSPNVVTLTRAEYDALSEADKMDGRFYYITDDAEVATSLVVQTNQNNPDTVPSSKVVYDETSAIRDALTIKSKTVHITNLTFLSSGFVNINSYKPSGMNNFLFATIWTMGTVSTHDAVTLTANGTYLLGTGGATLDSIDIAYFYTD